MRWGYYHKHLHISQSMDFPFLTGLPSIRHTLYLCFLMFFWWAYNFNEFYLQLREKKKPTFQLTAKKRVFKNCKFKHSSISSISSSTDVNTGIDTYISTASLPFYHVNIHILLHMSYSKKLNYTANSTHFFRREEKHENNNAEERKDKQQQQQQPMANFRELRF